MATRTTSRARADRIVSFEQRWNAAVGIIATGLARLVAVPGISPGQAEPPESLPASLEPSQHRGLSVPCREPLESGSARRLE